MGAVRPPSAKRPIPQEDDARSIWTIERKRDNLSLRYGKGVSTEPVSLQGMASLNECGVSGRAWAPIIVAFRDIHYSQHGEMPYIQHHHFGALIAVVIVGQQ